MRQAQVPTSHALLGDATSLPDWLMELVPAMTFSTGSLVLGVVLVGFASRPHGSSEQTAYIGHERVVDYCVSSGDARVLHHASPRSKRSSGSSAQAHNGVG